MEYAEGIDGSASLIKAPQEIQKSQTSESEYRLGFLHTRLVVSGPKAQIASSVIKTIAASFIALGAADIVLVTTIGTKLPLLNSGLYRAVTATVFLTPVAIDAGKVVVHEVSNAAKAAAEYFQK